MANKFQATMVENLSPLLARLGQVGRGDRRLMQAAGDGMKTLIELGFRKQQDPYGQAWKPTLRGGQILRDKGTLRNSFTSVARERSVQVGTAVCYAPVHQFGATVTASGAPGGAGRGKQSLCGYTTTGAEYLRFRIGGQYYRVQEVNIPQRMMMPMQSRGWPPAWRDAITKRMTNRWEKMLAEVPPPQERSI